MIDYWLFTSQDGTRIESLLRWGKFQPLKQHHQCVSISCDCHHGTSFCRSSVNKSSLFECHTDYLYILFISILFFWCICWSFDYVDVEILISWWAPIGWFTDWDCSSREKQTHCDDFSKRLTLLCAACLWPHDGFVLSLYLSHGEMCDHHFVSRWAIFAMMRIFHLRCPKSCSAPKLKEV